MERDNFFQLEFDDRVVGYEVQPVEIRFVLESGRVCSGFPDVAVTHAEGNGPSEVQDVKYRRDLFDNWTHLRPRLRAASQYAREEGCIYRIRSELEIRTPFLAQAKFLYRYLLGVSPESRFCESFTSALREKGACTAQILLTACTKDVEKAIALPTLWNLIATRTISADLERPLTMSSLLWLPDASS